MLYPRRKGKLIVLHCRATKNLCNSGSNKDHIAIVQRHLWCAKHRRLSCPLFKRAIKFGFWASTFAQVAFTIPSKHDTKMNTLEIDWFVGAKINALPTEVVNEALIDMLPKGYATRTSKMEMFFLVMQRVTQRAWSIKNATDNLFDKILDCWSLATLFHKRLSGSQW